MSKDESIPASRLARLGRWCLRHRWRVVGVWLILFVGGALVVESVEAALVGSSDPRQVESVQGRDAVAAALGATGGEVIGLVDGVDPQARSVRDAVILAADRIGSVPDVREVDTPYSPGSQPAAAYLSADRRALLVVTNLAEVTPRRQDAAVDEITARLHALTGALISAGQPQATVLVGGEVAIERQGVAAEQRDLERGEVLSLPITAVVLVLVFGGLVAAGTPVLAALVSIGTAVLALFGISRLTDLNSNVLTVVTVLGLALSIDYSLLLVARYREELLDDGTPEDAIGRAWATAGRTIVFSALTMAAALSGLLLLHLPLPFALGVAGMCTAVIAMLVALTFTGAVIGLARGRIRPARRARVARQRDPTAAAAAGENGFFARLAGLVQRRAAVIAIGTTVLLLAAGTPLLTTTFRRSGLAQLPPGTEGVTVEQVLADRFGRAAVSAITVVARAEPGPLDPNTLDRWAARWAGDPAVTLVQPAEQLSPNVAEVSFEVTGDSQGGPARDLVARLRADRPPGVRSWVTGEAATLTDTLDLIRQGLPWAATVTVLAMVALLFAMTGSVVVPVKAILANVISLAATFGVLNAVFQHGWLAGPLDTLTLGGLDPFMLVIIFAFAFGISIDYEVFLLSRVREYADAGYDPDAAVRRGLQRTGRIITSAAAVVVIVFACFGGAKTGEIEQLGIGLSVAVLVDATIVRCLLVPSMMTLLGKWVWWSPTPLRRLAARLNLGENRVLALHQDARRAP
jgi:putative drug exporter of the RND superfamily